MRIYAAGVGGMLGSAFYESFSSENDLRCTDKDVNESWLSYLDFRDINAYRKDVASFRPDFLFHIGALTDLEYQEREKDDAYMTNVIGTENAVTVANELGIPILYISTAGIFDGSLASFDDWDTPNPLCVYARTKYIGERIVREQANDFIVCRAGWMMGGGLRKDKKFIGKLIRQIVDGKTTLNIVTDKSGTPTYTRDFAENVKYLISNRLRGIYNLACPGKTSRFDVANELVRLLGLEGRINVNPVDSSFFSKEYFAPRPACEALVGTHARLRGIPVMRDWKTALADYVSRDFNNLVETEYDMRAKKGITKKSTKKTKNREPQSQDTPSTVSPKTHTNDTTLDTQVVAIEPRRVPERGLPLSRFVDGSFLICFTGHKELADATMGDSIRMGLRSQQIWQFPTPLDKYFSDSVPHTFQFDEHSGWANSWFGHYRAVKTAYELGCDRALIMEDDCRFLRDRGRVDEIVSHMPEDADFALLDHFFCKWDTAGRSEYENLVADSVTPYWHRFSYDFYSAACYMVSRRAMERLIWLHESLIDPNTQYRMMRVTDYWHNRGNMGDINMYFCTPNCAIQRNADTEAERLSDLPGINSYYRNMGIVFDSYAQR